MLALLALVASGIWVILRREKIAAGFIDDGTQEIKRVEEELELDMHAQNQKDHDEALVAMEAEQEKKEKEDAAPVAGVRAFEAAMLAHAEKHGDTAVPWHELKKHHEEAHRQRTSHNKKKGG